MNIGVLTGGGDCPGLNAVIRAVVRKGIRTYGDTVIGFHDGWRGVTHNKFEELSIERMRGTLPKGGTTLGTSRFNPFKVDGGVEMVQETFRKNNIDALVSIGGEGTLSCTRAFGEKGLNVVGVPKTIDNDVDATERTFGFDTAVSIATEAIDRLHTTAESHDRIMVVEVMGRHVGHIATWSGIAGGATSTLIPEKPFDIARVCEALTRRHKAGRFASIVVVAEGAKPQPGTMDVPEDTFDEYGHIRLGGISTLVAAEIEKRTGYETRVTILGHTQRGGSPTAFDRVLSTRFGVAAIDAVHNGEFGKMVALQAGKIVTVSLEEATTELKTVDDDLWSTAQNFFA